MDIFLGGGSVSKLNDDETSRNKQWVILIAATLRFIWKKKKIQNRQNLRLLKYVGDVVVTTQKY